MEKYSPLPGTKREDMGQTTAELEQGDVKKDAQETLKHWTFVDKTDYN